jgi:hypothetical protein
MLRRFTSLTLVVLIVLCFAACSKKADAEKPVVTGFSCDVEVKYGEMDVKGRLTRSSAGTLIFDVNEPKTLNGLSMQWNGETISLKLHGFSFGVDPETVPQSALGKCILGVLDAALGMHDGGKVTDEGLVTKGSSSSGEFEILSDPKTGSLLRLRIPSENLTATFSNFKLT